MPVPGSVANSAPTGGTATSITAYIATGSAIPPPPPHPQLQASPSAMR